jgi:hypothetical protein
MVQEPFPGQGQDGEEPEGSSPLPAEGNGSNTRGAEGRDQRLGNNHADAAPAGPSFAAGSDEDDEDEVPPEEAEQGLFVTLPAEELTLAGFAEDGRADTMAPGPLLAAVVHAVTGEDGTGLAGASEDQLIGIMSAARRMESRAAWTQMAAVREFARRHPAKDASGQAGTGFSEFAADEVASEFRLNWYAAAEQIAYACAVATRLPKTFAALAAGLIHPVHVRIIEDETRVLSKADATTADEVLAQAAASKTFGELRYAAHRLVLKLDPEAARHRKEQARQDAHVRRFREDSGNAGMVAREMPTDEVLASWQHIDQRARDLHAAGMPGTLQELRVRAYLDLLQERDCRDNPDDSSVDRSGGAVSTDDPHGETGNPDGSRGTDGPDGPGGPDGNGGPGPADSPHRTGPDGHARHAQDKGPSIAALVNITVPWSALQGDTGPPGEAAGFGLLDHQTARDLVTAAARNPRTRWCVTALHPDGTAAAHGCAVGPHPWPTGPRSDVDHEPPGPLKPADHPTQFLRALKITLNMVIRGPCNHAQAQHRYRPGRELQHLVRARNARCTAPGCGRPAARCDLDHTDPWHHGGKTCPCNLAPLCRHHHRCKQAQGWWLEQPEPGVLKWRTPAGRTYTTTPTEYPT